MSSLCRPSARLLAAALRGGLLCAAPRARAQEGSVPAKPTGLSAVATHASVTLAWDDPGNTSITGYVILRRDIVRQSPGVFTTVEADTGTAATTYTDGGVEPETRYAYRIKAVNAHGTSSRSGYVNVETPAAPAARLPLSGLGKSGEIAGLRA